MQIVIGKYSGYCPGVKRAIKILDGAIDAAAKSKTNKNIYTAGEIIHNPRVVDSYLKKGVNIMKKSCILNPDDTLVIRSHGISPELKDSFKNMGADIIDATCPFVSKAHEIAKKLSEEGYFIILIGEKNHPEVNGIAGNIKTGCYAIIENENEIKNLNCRTKIAVLSQTTQPGYNFDMICRKLIGMFSCEIRIFRTICQTTNLRQKEAVKLASLNDVIIVVGGRNSANTKKLNCMAASVQKKTYHIEDEAEVKKEWFKTTDKVAIISGASTPYDDLENVRKKIESFF